MKKKKKTSNSERIKQEEQYIEFLKKRLDSKNFKTNVSSEEYGKTQKKYEKAKLLLKFLKS